MARTALLLSGFGALVLVLLLGALVTASGSDAPLAIDQAWNAFMAATRPSGLVAFAVIMNGIGGGWVAVFLVPVVVAVLLLIARRPRAAGFALLAFAASAGLVQVLKHVFGRARPEEMLVVSDYGSFPSGHTANAATIAVVLVLVFPRLWVGLVGAAWMLAMAFSRTVLSVHWLTDTLGGALAGVSVALVLGGVLLRWLRAGSERSLRADPRVGTGG